MPGVPELRRAVSHHNRRFYGIEADPEAEVVVTSGATEAITACLMAVLDPGDECVLIEPLYDTYLPVVRLLGAVPKLVRLQPPRWELPRAELAAAFGPRTKAVLLNSPMNPTGKVFTAAELAFVAELVARHDCYAVCDEVYEHLTFDGWRHIPLMTLPGMRERCMRIGSAGKTFSLTGWKVGYVTCDRSLAANVAKAHQNLTFTTAPNLQRGVAVGLMKEDGYFAGISAALQAKRDLLAAGLAELGFGVLPTQGSYFITADFRPLGFTGDDVAFCRTLTEEAGVTAIPVTAFYADPGSAPEPLRPLRLLQGRCGDRRGAGADAGLDRGAPRPRVDGGGGLALFPAAWTPCGGHSSVGRAPGCGPGCHGFESRWSPHPFPPPRRSAGSLLRP